MPEITTQETKSIRITTAIFPAHVRTIRLNNHFYRIEFPEISLIHQNFKKANNAKLHAFVNGDNGQLFPLRFPGVFAPGEVCTGTNSKALSDANKAFDFFWLSEFSYDFNSPYHIRMPINEELGKIYFREWIQLSHDKPGLFSEKFSREYYGYCSGVVAKLNKFLLFEYCDE